jgi:hypothetical protein
VQSQAPFCWQFMIMIQIQVKHFWGHAPAASLLATNTVWYNHIKPQGLIYKKCFKGSNIEVHSLNFGSIFQLGG